MSIVLDALRKAEAERARGEVPGLHSGLGPAQLPLPSQHMATLPWAGVALGAGGLLLLISLVVGAGAWWRWVNAGVPQVAPAASVASTAPVAAPAVAPPPVAAPAAALPPLASVPLATATVASAAVFPLAPPASPARTGVSAFAPVAAAAAAASVSAASAVAPVATNAASTATPTVASLPPPDGRPVALADLPEDVRRELPALSIGGLIQMDDPPRRSLIINGAIVMEGESIQPGLLLERIGNGQAVLRFKAWRVLLGI